MTTAVRQRLGRLGDAIDAFGARRAAPRLHALYRLIFGALALVMAVRSLPLVDYLWFHRMPAWAGLGPALNQAWVILAALVCVGLGGRVALVVHFIVSTAVIDLEISGSNVEETLYIVNAFWLAFTGTGRWSVDAWLRRRADKDPISVPAWPLWLMGFNLGLLLFLAGLTKSFDPLWRQGTGFYYTFVLPWLKTDIADALLDQRWLMVALNHAAFVYELGFVVLFLIPRLRLVGLAMVAFFFGSLAFPFELGFIGPLGLTMLLGVLAATARTDVAAARWWWQRLRRRPAPLDARPAVTASRPPSRAVRVTIAALVAHMLFFFVHAATTYSLRYPLMFWPLSVVEDDGTVHPPEKRGSFLVRLVERVPWLQPAVVALLISNEHTTKVRPFVLFSSVHTVGIWVYRIQVQLMDGRTLEPFRLVTDEMYAGRDSAGLRPRFLQASMYGIGDIANHWAADPQFRLDPRTTVPARALFTHALGRLAEADRAQVGWLSLLVRPIAVPDGYRGRVEVDAVPWRELLRYDPVRGGMNLIERPDPFPSQPVVEGLEHPARIVVRP